MTSSARARIDVGTIQAERLAGLQIGDQLEGGRLLHRQVGGLGALKDPSGVNTDLAPGAGAAGPVADQPSGVDKFTPVIDRRNGIACCQRDELLLLAEEERIGADQ